MDDVRCSFFAPAGTYFSVCPKYGGPTMQFYHRPTVTCVWCCTDSELTNDVNLDDNSS